MSALCKAARHYYVVSVLSAARDRQQSGSALLRGMGIISRSRSTTERLGVARSRPHRQVHLTWYLRQDASGICYRVPASIGTLCSDHGIPCPTTVFRGRSPIITAKGALRLFLQAENNQSSCCEHFLIAEQL